MGHHRCRLHSPRGSLPLKYGAGSVIFVYLARMREIKIFKKNQIINKLLIIFIIFAV